MSGSLQIPLRQGLQGDGIARHNKMKIVSSARREAAAVPKYRWIRSEQSLPSQVNPMLQVKLNFERRAFEDYNPTRFVCCNSSGAAPGYNYCDVRPKNSVVRDPEQSGKRRETTNRQTGISGSFHAKLDCYQPELFDECATQPRTFPVGEERRQTPRNDSDEKCSVEQLLYAQKSAKQQKQQKGGAEVPRGENALENGVKKLAYPCEVRANAPNGNIQEDKRVSDALRTTSISEQNAQQANPSIVKYGRGHAKTSAYSAGKDGANCASNEKPTMELEIVFFTLSAEKAEKQRTASQIEKNIRLYRKMLDRADLQAQDRQDLAALARAAEARVDRIRRYNQQCPAAEQ